MTIHELKSMNENEFYKYIKETNYTSTNDVSDIVEFVLFSSGLYIVGGGSIGFAYEELVKAIFKDDRSVLAGTVFGSIMGLVAVFFLSYDEIKKYKDIKNGLKDLKKELNNLSYYEFDSLKQIMYDKKFKNYFVDMDKLKKIYSDIEKYKATKLLEELSTSNYGVYSSNYSLSKIKEFDEYTYGVSEPVVYKDSKLGKKELEKVLGI